MRTSGFLSRLGFLALIGLIGLSASSIPAHRGEQRSLTQAPVQLTWDKKESFAVYSQDFARMAQAYGGTNDLQYEIAMELAAVAARAYERIDSAETIVMLYGGTACSPGRSGYRSAVITWLSTASNLARVDADDIQTNLAFVSKPGMAAEALKMKDDLQESRQWVVEIRDSVP